MKKPAPIFLFLLLIVFLFSCSSNQFTVRKNFHPRVKIEATTQPVPSHHVETPIQAPHSTAIVEKEPSAIDKPDTEQKINRTYINKTHITKTIAIHKTPHKIKLSKKRLNKTNATNMDEAQVAGLVVSIIALCLAIASYMMIIWMANGGVFAGFIVGLVLAAAAIAMGFLGGTLPFRGISWLARILGILAVIVLTVFLLLILVGII